MASQSTTLGSKDWAIVTAKLSFGKTKEEEKIRGELFRKIDINSNGYLSLAELEKGIRDELKLFNIPNQAILRAFQVTKNISPSSQSTLSNDFVELKEFRFFLMYLRQYLELHHMFNIIDNSQDHRISFDEFQRGIPQMNKWGANIEDPGETFKEIDVDGGGMVLFDEFAAWAMKRGLDLEDDDDASFEDMGKRGESNFSQKAISQQEKKENSSSPSSSTPPPKEIERPTKEEWAVLTAKLCFQKTPQNTELRQKLFNKLDTNGNGYLSLAELEKGIRDELKLPKIFASKQPILRSFQVAKDVSPSSSLLSNDFVEFKEFRLFLMYLRQYLELYLMFEIIDSLESQDHRISFEEFRKGVPQLNKWGANIIDLDSTFKEIDVDKGGMVLFDEFAAWAMKRGLDLEDDDDATFEDFGDRGSSNLSQNQLQKRSCITNREEPESGPSVKKPNSENVLRPSKEEWSALTAKLCFQKTPQQATARQKLFQRIDVNGNGYLSLAELEKGIRDELRLPKIFDSKQAVLRAFQVAKDTSPPSSSMANDFVELKEFRVFLMYFRQYLELYHMFNIIDSEESRDHRISLEEFRQGIPQLNRWGANISDPAATFKEIDVDGGGMILFDEFAAWAMKRELDLEDDDDASFEDIGNKGATNLSRNQTAKAPKTPQKSTLQTPEEKISSQTARPTREEWAALTAKLCYQKTPKQAEIRQKMFRRIDVNGNGYLSVAELEKGIRDEFKLPKVFNSKQAILRAFQVAKDASPSLSNLSDDFVELKEFRLFLMYLRQYFELYVMFDIIDSEESRDHRISLEEFRKGVPQLNKWGAKIGDPEATFKEIDVDGGGMILFDEFAAWAMKRELDLEDDDDASFEDIGNKGATNLSRNQTAKAPKTPQKSTQQTPQSPKKLSSQTARPTRKDWALLTSKLCFRKTPQQAAERQKMFRRMDMNGNGYLSLAELERGIRDELKLPKVFNSKQAVLRAFQVAKDASPLQSNLSDDFVEFKEFRLFLMYLRQYFELYVMFDIIDSEESRDHRISLEEFRKGVPQLNKWGAKIGDPEATFKEIDVDGGGMILFDEFAAWAMKRGLDLEDDDDASFEDIGNKGATNLSRNQTAKASKSPHRLPKQSQSKPIPMKGPPNRAPKQIKGPTKEEWSVLTSKLCFRKTPQQAAERQKMFRRMDMNGNGYLSLAELEKGIRYELKLPSHFRAKQAVFRAFQAAKDVSSSSSSSSSSQSNDFVEFKEFRLFLMYLRQYLELHYMFRIIDSDEFEDHRISVKEFRQGVQQLNKWGGKIDDPEKTFKEIDVDGGGMILFDEFAAWAIKRGLDLEDDDDASFEDFGNRGASNLSRNQIAKGPKSPSKPTTPQKRTAPTTLKKKEEITAQLCFQKSGEQTTIRQKLFKRMDLKRKDCLSVADLERGVKMEVKLPEKFDVKQGILLAFEMTKSQTKLGKESLEFREFRLFLVFLHQYLQLIQLFLFDIKNPSTAISMEVMKKHFPQLLKWGAKVERVEEIWEEIGEEKEKSIVFGRFVEWIVKRGLDLEGK